MATLKRWNGTVWVPVGSDTFLGKEEAAASYAPLPEAVVFSQPGTPDTAPLDAGAEYVWFKTDGAGNLLDILSGVKA